MPWIELAVAVLVAVVLTFVVSALVAWVFSLVARRKDWAKAFVTRMRRPFRWSLLVVLLTIALSTTLPRLLGADYPGQEAVSQLFRCTVIVVVAWFVGALALSEGRDRFGMRIAGYFAAWRDALTGALHRAGRAEAETLAEDAVLAIQGGLVLARALDDPGVFERLLARLERQLCGTP